MPYDPTKKNPLGADLPYLQQPAVTPPMAAPGTKPYTPPAAAPAAPLGGPAPVLGTSIGNHLRAGIEFGVNSQLKSGEMAANAVTAPFRAIGGVARDAGRALFGMAPDAHAGESTPGFDFGTFKMPTLNGAPAKPAAKPAVAGPATPGAPASAVKAAPQAAEGSKPAPVSPPAMPEQRPAITGASLVAGMKTLDGTGRPSVASSVGAHGENVYDNASIARLGAQAGSSAAGPAAMATPTALAPIAAVPQVAAAPVRPTVASEASFGGVIKDPEEARRRLSIALMTDGKGSPEVRRALMAGFQAEQGRDAAAHENALNRVTAAQTADRNAALAANATQQQQAFDAQRVNAASAQNESQFGRKLASDERIATLPRPQLVTDKDGRTSLVTGATSQTVTDKDGNALMQPAPGALTAAQQVNAYTEALKALGNDMTPEGAAKRQELTNAITSMSNGDKVVAPSAPPAGTVKGGFRFKGGDPADKNNWEAVR